MFAKLAVPFVSLVTLAHGVLGGPVALRPSFELAARGYNYPSFNNWGGFSSLSGFDGFYGSDNFDGSHSSQVVIKQQQQVVCHSQKIELIQQRLVVLSEMAKKIITEQICEVETQTIVFEQWHSSLHGFSRDLRHLSGHQIGYDSSIASHLGSIVGSDGSLNTNDFGFSGQDVGKSTVVVGGSNWDDNVSPSRVHDAYQLTRTAYHAVHPEL